MLLYYSQTVSAIATATCDLRAAALLLFEAITPGAQRELGPVRAPGSSYLKGIGSVGSSLPLVGPDERSILEFFELISVWAETAHFQLPTPRG